MSEMYMHPDMLRKLLRGERERQREQERSRPQLELPLPPPPPPERDDAADPDGDDAGDRGVVVIPLFD